MLKSGCGDSLLGTGEQSLEYVSVVNSTSEESFPFREAHLPFTSTVNETPLVPPSKATNLQLAMISRRFSEFSQPLSGANSTKVSITD